MARYIDADKLREYWLENGVNECVYNTNNVLDSIDYQLTANVAEVKHGKWEKPTLNLECFADRYVICSECNVMLPNITEIPEYYYCPNCGAKMDGGE